MKTLVNFRLTSIAIAIITLIAIPTAIAGSDSVISGALIQSGYCGQNDYVCLFRIYSEISIAIIIICFLLDLVINKLMKIKKAKHHNDESKASTVLSVQSLDDKKAKPKTLNRVIAHVEYDDNKVYVLIENKECKIDVTCSNITVYKVNSLDRTHTISGLDMEDVFNGFLALGDKILVPYAKIEDVIISINHKDKIEVNLLAINSSENRLEFKTLSPRNPLTPGLYSLVFGFTVYPQREGYEDFDIYITARINYRGGSDLELWELRNARTRD